MPSSANLPQDRPRDPFALIAPSTLDPAGHRPMRVFGGAAELLWVPQRSARAGTPQSGRPPFARSRVEQILARESVWSGGGCAITPNRYPLADRELLLWTERPKREWDLALLTLAFALEEDCGGTVLGNYIGAAASNPWAHLHLAGQPCPYLDGMPRHELPREEFDGLPEVSYVGLDLPFPGVAVGAMGPAAARARAIEGLLQRRMTAACNLVSAGGISWLFPRTPIETPAPYFPWALGASELGGRWFFADEATFARASHEDLEEAIRLGCVNRPGQKPSEP